MSVTVLRMYDPPGGWDVGNAWLIGLPLIPVPLAPLRLLTVLPLVGNGTRSPDGGVSPACCAEVADAVEPEVGVGGTSAGILDAPGVYLPMNQDGTQPRSPVSSLMA